MSETDESAASESNSVEEAGAMDRAESSEAGDPRRESSPDPI
ncbi:hypothetical protein [Halorubrum sp. Ib24]|nr:hypothetical protein [Halorubrum sp. Ib24]